MTNHTASDTAPPGVPRLAPPGSASTSPGGAPPLVLAAKLRPPAPPTPFVTRERLLADLTRSAPARLLVTGPAGTGKTTLLALWFRRVAATAPLVWLSLDEADADPTRLWTHLLYGARTSCPRVGGQALRALSDGAPVIEVVVPHVLRDLAALDTPVAIALDDLHALGDGEARASVEALAARLPAGITLAMTSRQGLTEAQLRWVMHDDARHVGAEDLRFSCGEIAELARRVRGQPVEATVAASLDEATGGWAAPVRWACQQLGADGAGATGARTTETRTTETRTTVRLAPTSSDTLHDYLAVEVLGTTDPSTLRGLEILARPRRFNYRLVADLAPEAVELLSPVHRESLGIRHLGDGWFTVHQLVRDVLLDRADSRSAPATYAALARWHRAHGLIEEAAGHALRSGDRRLLGEVIAAAWPGLVDAGRVATVARLLADIPPELLFSSAPLLTTAAWVAGFRQDREERNRLLDAALALGTKGPLPDGTESVAHAAALNRCLLPDDHSRLLANAELAAELTPRRSRWLGVARMGRGAAWFAAGDYENCLGAHLDAAARVGPLLRTVCTGRAALAAVLADDLPRAHGLIAEARRLLANTELAAVPWAGLPDCAHGFLLLRSGKPTEALTPFRRAAATLAALVEPHPLLVTQLGLTECHALLDDSAAADAALARADSRARAVGDVGAHFAGLLAAARATHRGEYPPTADREAESLTERERSVLRLLTTTQLSQAEIAETLVVSRNTVKTHTQAIYRKLRVSSRGHAAGRAAELGLTPRPAQSLLGYRGAIPQRGQPPRRRPGQEPASGRGAA